MKKTLIYYLVLLLSNLAEAQSLQATDRVVLLDQTSHDGVILEQVPGERLVLYRVAQKDTLTINIENISRMIRLFPGIAENSVEVKENPIKSRSFKPFNTGPAYVMLHYATGGGSGGDYIFHGFGLSVGANTYWGLQVGFSAQYLSGESNVGQWQPSRQTVPLGLDARYIIKSAGNGRFTTLLAVSGGYNFTLNGQYYDDLSRVNYKIGTGFFFHPGLAFRINFWQNTGLMFDIGYLYNYAPLIHLDSGTKTSQTAWHNIILRGSFFF
jgi:hypothetical protein